MVSPASRAEFDAREFFQQETAIEGLVTPGEKATVGAGEHRGKFLEAQQVRIERVDERVDRFLKISELDVIITFGKNSALTRSDKDRFDIAAGERPGAQLLTNVSHDRVAEIDLFTLAIVVNNVTTSSGPCGTPPLVVGLMQVRSRGTDAA